MKHLFIPYPLAVLAKEKGFKEKCIATYDVNKKIELHDYSAIGISILSAPLYQQIIDWFREKHDLCIEVGYRNAYKKFTGSIHPIYPKTLAFVGEFCDEYYGSMNKTIEQAFKLI